MKLSYQSAIISSALLLLLIIALLSAALWLPASERKVKVMDLLFVLDITQSMDVADAELNGEAVSRLVWAKHYSKQVWQTLPCGSHVGLAVFSGWRSLVLINPVEICASYDDLIKMLAKIDRSISWELSSQVSKATFSAIDQAKLMNPVANIVFITDGHEAPPLHATLYPKYTKPMEDISGVFVGVGGDKLLPIPKHTADGSPDGFWQQNEVLHEDVYASLRSEDRTLGKARSKNEHLSSQKKLHLASLASRLNFAYLQSPNQAVTLIKTLQNQVKTREQVVNYDWANWLTGFALVLLLVLYLPFRMIAD